MRHSQSGLVLLALVGAMLACGPTSVEPVSIVEPDLLESPAPAPPEELPPTPTQWPTPVNQAWRTVALGVERRDVAHQIAHLAPDAAVLFHVGPDQHRVRTGLERLESRHGRMHAITPRDVARGHDHAAF